MELRAYDVDWGGGRPLFITRHARNLEMVATDPSDRWQFDLADLGPAADGGWHVCFVRDGNLVVY